MISVFIASIPERKVYLKRTVQSLRRQMDSLFVALNGYDHVPDFLRDGEYAILDNSMTDAARYYDIDGREGYLFTCDDDIMFPSNYCQDMIKKIDQYKCIVTLHGKNYDRDNIDFLQFRYVYRCLGDVHEDVQVDVGGTGVMAWHSDHFKVRYSDFKSPNMADCWVAKLAHEQGVPIMVIAHNRYYLRYMKQEDTIWRREKDKGAHEQTELLKTFLK